MLKSLVAATVVLLTTQNVYAVEFVNEDGSSLSKQCIEAAQSNKSHRAYQTTNVRCNGVSIAEFARKHQAVATKAVEATPKAIAFENSNNAPESELCIAAAKSNEELAEVAGRLGIRTQNVECNGVKLNKFAKRYNKESKS